MTDARLPTAIWVDAHLAPLNARGIFYYITHKGAPAGGMVLLKLNGLAGQVRLLMQQRDMDGVLGWVNVFEQELLEESKADAYIDRAVARDADLWVVEIEDRAMLNPFEE